MVFRSISYDVLLLEQQAYPFPCEWLIQSAHIVVASLLPLPCLPQLRARLADTSYNYSVSVMVPLPTMIRVHASYNDARSSSWLQRLVEL